MPWDPDMSALLSTQWQDVDATSTLYDVALKLSVDTLPVSISAVSSQLSNVLSSYVFKQCGQVIGTIDIPRDFLVKSAELKTVVEDDKPYEGAKVGDKYIDFIINDQTGSGGENHVYVPVNDLIDVYSGGTTDTVSVEISSDSTIYAYVRPESIVSSLIADNAVTTSKIADGQVSMPKLSSDVIEFTESMSAAAASMSDKKVFIDGISAESLCMLHISQEDFYEKVHTSSLLSNELYIVSSDYINAYGQRIENVGAPVDLNDAATKEYVDTLISSVPDLLSGLSVEMLSNDQFLSSQISALSNDVSSNDAFLSNQINSLSDDLHALSVTALSNDYFLSSQISSLSSDVNALSIEMLSNDEFLSSQISSLSSDVNALSNEVLSNDQALSTAVDSKIFIDGISAQSLCAVHISQEDFYEKVHTSSLLSNELYIVSSNYVNMYGQQVKNVGSPVDLSDAATKQYVDTLISSVPDLLSGLSAEMLSNDQFLSSQISALSTTLYETDDIAKLSAGDYAIGDIAVQKKDIDGVHQQYTAYRWSQTGTERHWAALDGNYDATNVYFPENLTMTYQFGKYTVPAAGSYELSCKGMSVAEMLNDAYSEVSSGTKTYPQFTFTLGSYTAAKEVGETYKIPTATLKMTSVGSYQYGPATGITVEAGKASVKHPEHEAKTNPSAMALNSTLQTDASISTHMYSDRAAAYIYSASAQYTQGAVPKNNIGKDDPSNRILSGSWSKTDLKATFTGHRYGFFGYRMSTEPRLDFNALSSSDIRTGIHAVKWDFTNNAWPSSFVVKGGSTQIVFAVPASVIGSNHQYIKMSNIALGTYFFDNDGLLRKTANHLSVDGAAAGTGIEYAVWTIDPSAPFASDTSYTIEYGATKKQ